MASRHEDFLSKGVRLVGVSVDSPSQNAAMIQKLDIPFPYLSDPDRSKAIGPFDVVDEKDARNLARPAMILVDTEGEERFRFVSRDFADRYPEDKVLEVAEGLGLPSATAEPMNVGDPKPGPSAMPFEGLFYYLRGARFAALAMGLRHKDLGESIKDDSKAYVESMDRMLEAIKAYTKRRSEPRDE